MARIRVREARQHNDLVACFPQPNHGNLQEGADNWQQSFLIWTD
jgi:hypothetical protein